MQMKKEFFDHLRELGLEYRGPIWPEFMKRSWFRRLVLDLGLGQLFTWFIHEYLVINPGAGAPKFRVLHVHNGSGREVRKVKVGRNPPPDQAEPPPPEAPKNDEPLPPGDWAFNDKFDDAGHLSDLENITVTLETPVGEGEYQTYAADIELNRPGSFIEQVWLSVLEAGEGFRLETILWFGPDDSVIEATDPPIYTDMHLQPQP